MLFSISGEKGGRRRGWHGVIVGEIADSLLPTWTKRASVNRHIDVRIILKYFDGEKSLILHL